MQSVSSRNWTRDAVSISYDDNHYTMGTSFYGISTIIGWYTKSCFYIYILNISDL